MQLPWLPEFLFEAQNFRAMTEALTKSSRPGTFSEQDFTAYRGAWRKPGAPTAMINWYRALRAPASAGNPVIEIPVRILWGALDRALSADLAELSLRYCKRGELTMFPDATHWLQHEEQESVSRALAEFFLPAPEGQGLRDKARDKTVSRSATAFREFEVNRLRADVASAS